MTQDRNVILHCQCQPPYHWQQIIIPSTLLNETESMGSKEKMWLTDPNSKHRWLYKQARDRNGFVRGEDWAECLVHVAAQDLCLPSACIALATHQGHRGLVSKSVLPDERSSLVHGSELLSRFDAQYDKNLGRHNPGYHLEAIRDCLKEHRGCWSYREWPAFDLLVGYLMMDALLAGRDRHHENWAVIQTPGRPGQLAPSFDHGNALAFSELPCAVTTLVNDDAKLQRWLDRGTSQHFWGQPSLVKLAVAALRMIAPEHRDYLRRSLIDFPIRRFAAVAEQMPADILSVMHARLIVRIV